MGFYVMKGTVFMLVRSDQPSRVLVALKTNIV